MATKFLRKIILEELNKVLKEQAGLEAWKSARPESRELDLGNTTFVGTKPLTPAQKYKLAVKGLQKQLKRLGGQQFNAYDISGKLDTETKAFLEVIYPGLDNNWHRALKTAEEVQEYTRSLKRITPQEYQVALLKSNNDSTTGIATGKNPTDTIPAKDTSAAPEMDTTPLSDTDKAVLATGEKVGASREQMKADKEKLDKEREAEKKVYPVASDVKDVYQESLIRKEINKLLKNI